MPDDDETPPDSKAPYSPDPAPDAGASLLGRYGLGNEMICWLLGAGHSEIAQMTPRDGAPRPRRCPRCGATMVWRPGKWACYSLNHDEAVEVAIPFFWPTIETGDVLNRAGEALDLVYEKGAWRVREL